MRASENSEKIFRGQKIEKNASKLGVVSFNPNKIIFMGNFVRGIDCAHRKNFLGSKNCKKCVKIRGCKF